jgi:hypothetical protein
MKDNLKFFGKIIGLTVLIITCDTFLNYFFTVVISFIFSGVDAYVFHFNPGGFVGAIFLRFLFIAGWAYLLAIVIYHFYRTREFLKAKFFWVIIFLFVFYLLVDLNARYADFMLTTTIYFAVVTGIYFCDKWFKKTSILFLIFMMFFYYYWFEDNFKNDVLIIHTLTYIPLAIIGSKLYDRLFPVKEEALKNEG